MGLNTEQKDYLIKAKQRSKKVMFFYIHLTSYIVFISLIVFNLYIVSGFYKNSIISLNLSIIVVWSVFMSIHALVIFKGHKIFKKRWEEKKIDQFLEDNEQTETKFWE